MAHDTPASAACQRGCVSGNPPLPPFVKGGDSWSLWLPLCKRGMGGFYSGCQRGCVLAEVLIRCRRIPEDALMAEQIANLINGRGPPSAGGKTPTSATPADTREVVAVAPSSSSRDVDEAVAAARAAWPAWRAMPAPRRGEIP